MSAGHVYHLSQFALVALCQVKLNFVTNPNAIPTPGMPHEDMLVFGGRQTQRRLCRNITRVGMKLGMCGQPDAIFINS